MKVRSCVKMADRFPEQSESNLTCLVDQKNGDRMIKQLLNSVIAKYRDLSVPRPIIVKYMMGRMWKTSRAAREARV